MICPLGRKAVGCWGGGIIPAVLSRGNGADDETARCAFESDAKKITWWDAAEIIGVTDRTMRRWRERLEEGGYSGLGDRRKGKPSPRRIALATVENVLRLYQEGC
jgi:hypothetical protein